MQLSKLGLAWRDVVKNNERQADHSEYQQGVLAVRHELWFMKGCVNIINAMGVKSL